MATTNDLLGVVRHYQRSIERHQDNADRLLHCVTKLYSLPIKVEHLQETGIGKTVNLLRKHSGDVGPSAKALVIKWKEMVTAEEDSAPVIAANEVVENNKSKHHKSSIEDRDEIENKQSNSSGAEATSPADKSSHRSHHKHDGKSTIEEHKTSQNRHSESRRHEKSKEHRNSHDHKDHRGSHEHKEHRNSHEHGEHKSRTDKSSKRKRENETKVCKENDRIDDGKHKNSTISKDEGESSSKRKRDNSTERVRDHKSSATKDRSEKNLENGKEHKENHRSERSKHKHHHRDRRSDSHRDHQSDGNRDRHSGSHRDRHSDNNSNRKEHSIDKLPASNSTSSSTTNANQSKNAAETVNNKRQHISGIVDNERSISKAKVTEPKTKDKHKTKNSNETDGEDTDGNTGDFDSSMGANFADVLGMLNKPSSSKKLKKSSSTSKPNGATHVNLASSSSSTQTLSKESSKSSKLSTNPTLNGPILDNEGTAKKPYLLSSTAKLEPLDANILVDLPTTIATNYKPKPVNQTVMDVVFNTHNNGASSSHASNSANKRSFDESEALAQGISSKTMRTKIYSGVRTGQMLKAPSLFDICIRVLQKNIDALEYTGGVPFDVLRSVLERATPQQLLTFEDFNPYIMEDSDVLWQLHVQRQFRGKQRQEMESWREMFMRCQEEKDLKLSNLAEAIRKQQKIKETPIRKTQLAFVDTMVKPPRGIQRKQDQYGTKSKLIATPAARVAALSSVTPNAAKAGDARLRVMAAARDTAQVAMLPVRPKKAPLMAKTLQLLRGRHKR